MGYARPCTEIHAMPHFRTWWHLSPLSRGGQIWVEDCHGSVPEMTPDGLKVGKDLEVAKGPVVFDAYKAFHFTLAWEGERLVVVAYVTDHLDTLKDVEKQVLERQGFQLPSQEAETSEAIELELEFGVPHGRSQPGAEPVFKPELCGNRGLPLQAEWEGKKEPLNDGLGLCSPTCWRPADKGATLSPSSVVLCRDMYQMCMEFVGRNVSSPKELCEKLAAGEITESPFGDEEMQQLREKWCRRVGGDDWKHCMEIPKGQPFLLKAVARTAEVMGDPDWASITEGTDNFCTGVPIGFGEALPRLPQVFEPKAKWRKFDEDLPERDRSNYTSASLNSQQLLEKFREEVELGRMEASTHGALKQRYGEENLRIASMGAIQKPDGSVRPVHDGTHGLHVNQSITQHNLLSVPGPGELALLVRQSQEQVETPFALAGDVAAARRLVLVRERDWGLLACRAEAGSDTVFVNRVGTFGISSVLFWWARLFGVIGRVVGRAMLNHFFFQLVFVDDLHTNFFGHRKYVNALIWLVLYLMAGTPFAWKKFKGGARIAFIGYELDYTARLVGLSKVRGSD